MTEDQIRELAYHLTDVLADRWHVDRCGTDQADEAALVAAFLKQRLEALLAERPPSHEYPAEDIATVAQCILRGVYTTNQITPNVRVLARDYLRLREVAERPQPQFDLLEDPARGLHAVLTRHGIASRSDYQSLVTALIHWAAAACRSSGHAPAERPQPQEAPHANREIERPDRQLDGGRGRSDHHDGSDPSGSGPDCSDELFADWASDLASERENTGFDNYCALIEEALKKAYRLGVKPEPLGSPTP